MDLHNHKDWDNQNGLLSVSLEPQLNVNDSQVFVMLNGSTGNFCLDYEENDFNLSIAIQRAWSSDTGYYVKILPNDRVTVVRWWDGYEETLPASKISDKPDLFYKAITKEHPSTGTIISFAKEAFVKLRNCIEQVDNGQVSLRTFMYLLAALEQGVDSAKEVNQAMWQLEAFDEGWISSDNWEWLYSSFQKGAVSNGQSMRPLVNLVLRHASNRLFQEAHREATRKSSQTVLFGWTPRNYDGDISEGAFYTPTPLVRTLVQEALWALDKAKSLCERDSLTILDPACGSAEFLREALRQLKMKDFKGGVTVVGWDKSKIACEMANFVLRYESRTEWDDNVVIRIVEQDSIEYDWTQESKFDLVLMNPPFTAFEYLGERKALILDKLKGFAKRQPDAAALFWKNASEIVAIEGVLGLVLPHSLLGAETYSPLRKYLKEELRMEFSLIGRLGSAGLFEKAMIIPNVLVGTKQTQLMNHTVLWTNYEQTSVYEALRELRKYRLADIPTPIATASYSIYENENLTDVSNSHNWVVRSYQVFQLNEELKEFNTVGKLFNVTRGADAGNNAAFLLKKETWESLPSTERSYFRPSIMRDSIESGRLKDNFYLFYPYGKYAIQSEAELTKKVPVFYKRNLLINKSDLQKRRGREQRWWELNEHRPWQVEKSTKLISAYFGKSGYFALDLKGEFLVGQSFAWLPKKEELAERPYYFAYLALLHAPLIDTLLEMVCNVLHGGYYDMSKHYIEKMPIPDLTKANSDTLSYLISAGESIHNGEPIEISILNQVVASSYGLDLEKFIFS